MDELNKIATEIALHTNSVAELLNEKLQDYRSHKSKSRAGSTPYASKRKKKRKK